MVAKDRKSINTLSTVITTYVDEKEQVRAFVTCGSAWSRSGTVKLSTAVLQQQVVLGLGDEPLAPLVLLHHIQRLNHIMEVVGADEGQPDVLEDL